MIEWQMTAVLVLSCAVRFEGCHQLKLDLTIINL